MQSDKFSSDPVERALQEFGDKLLAQVSRSRFENPSTQYRVVLSAADLGTAVDASTPRRFSVPFKGVAVEDATDSSVSVYLKPHSEYAHQDGIKMGLNSSRNFDNPLAGCAVYWNAQPGKTLTLVFYTDGNFSSGKTVNVTAGGVTVSEGSSITTRSNTGLNIPASTPTIVLPADPLRITETLVNKTGATLWLGDSNVTDDAGSAPGIEVPPNGQWICKNTGAVYAFCTVAQTNAKIGRIRENN